MAEDDEKYSANSELRYMTLELMKMAQRRKLPFKKMAEEFVSNTYELAGMLQEIQGEAWQEESSAEKGRGQRSRNENE